jgi:hypothetical protein
MFMSLSLAIAGFELMLREQDWSGIIADSPNPSEAVYPVYLLAVSTALLIAVAVHMVTLQMIG